MSISLQKGQKLSLSKEQPGLSKVIVGLGWDEAVSGRSIDCDAFAILLTDGKVAFKSDVVYFGNLRHTSGSVVHMGDNLTGAGDGDDEQITIDLNSVPAQYGKIVIAVNIYQARNKHQHFGMIRNAFIRLVDSRTGSEVCVYNLTDNYSGQMAVIFGELCRDGGEWKFSAVGQGTTDGSVSEVAGRYGLATSASSSSSGGCYVATAVYGSYDCPQVWTLRRYRDYTLAETLRGRAFIKAYYAVSPAIVKWFGHTEWFKKMWKGRLDRMVSDLNSKGVEDTPYHDRAW